MVLRAQPRRHLEVEQTFPSSPRPHTADVIVARWPRMPSWVRTAAACSDSYQVIVPVGGMGGIVPYSEVRGRRGQDRRLVSLVTAAVQAGEQDRRRWDAGAQGL